MSSTVVPASKIVYGGTTAQCTCRTRVFSFRQVADNGVAGIHIMGSNNFTFEATIDDQCFGVDCVLEGEGRVGSLDGQQPIEVIVESSTNIKFKDMRVLSANGA